MHSKIIEIGTEKKKRADYIQADGIIYEEYDHFADYVQSVPRESEKDIMSWLDKFEIFTRNGRELTLRPIGGFIDDWKMKIVEMAKNLDMTNWMSYYDIKNVLRKTHFQSDLMICFNGEEFWEFGYFVQHIYENNQPGNKFYIGGILDYHY